MQTITTERTRQIQAIIARRLPLREKIATVETNLRSLDRCDRSSISSQDNAIAVSISI